MSVWVWGRITGTRDKALKKRHEKGISRIWTSHHWESISCIKLNGGSWDRRSTYSLFTQTSSYSHLALWKLLRACSWASLRSGITLCCHPHVQAGHDDTWHGYAAAHGRLFGLTSFSVGVRTGSDRVVMLEIVTITRAKEHLERTMMRPNTQIVGVLLWKRK